MYVVGFIVQGDFWYANIFSHHTVILRPLGPLTWSGWLTASKDLTHLGGIYRVVGYHKKKKEPRRTVGSPRHFWMSLILGNMRILAREECTFDFTNQIKYLQHELSLYWWTVKGRIYAQNCPKWIYYSSSG